MSLFLAVMLQLFEDKFKREYHKKQQVTRVTRVTRVIRVTRHGSRSRHLLQHHCIGGATQMHPLYYIANSQPHHLLTYRAATHLLWHCMCAWVVTRWLS